MTYALVISHPGHELRIYDWLKRQKPIVSILTDGSGKSNNSRMHGSTKIFQALDIPTSPIYGSYTDRYFYSKILSGDAEFFINLCEKIFQFFIKERIEFVAADAIEGYNPTHDICRMIINVVIEKIKKKLNVEIKNYDFLLDGNHKDNPDYLSSELMWTELHPASLLEKINFIKNYPALQPEVDSLLQKHGDKVLKFECLRRYKASHFNFIKQKPFYEIYGEQQIKSGIYTNLISYQQHILPLIKIFNLWLQHSNDEIIKNSHN
jgi:hypothetical protein